MQVIGRYARFLNFCLWKESKVVSFMQIQKKYLGLMHMENYSKVPTQVSEEKR